MNRRRRGGAVIVPGLELRVRSAAIARARIRWSGRLPSSGAALLLLLLLQMGGGAVGWGGAFKRKQAKRILWNLLLLLLLLLHPSPWGYPYLTVQ